MAKTSPVPSGSVTCLGLTATVLAGTDRASSSPLRSKIDPREARSGRARVHCAVAALRSWSPSRVCSRPTLTRTAASTRSTTTRVAISRRRGCPAEKRFASRRVRVVMVRRARWRGSGVRGERGRCGFGGRTSIGRFARSPRAGRLRPVGVGARRPARGRGGCWRRRGADFAARSSAITSSARRLARAGSRRAAGAEADRRGGPPARRPVVAARRVGACWRRPTLRPRSSSCSCGRGRAASPRRATRPPRRKRSISRRTPRPP